MTLPIITQHASAGTQAGGEKTDLTTTAFRVRDTGRSRTSRCSVARTSASR